ncbi:hypothetical protein QP888_10135 [Corynebacterium sp. MSK297]|uniref:hypothetical protein n=1 Tax=Corynebacterium sp. MSK297 TaxID=3050221 RepID=UPI00254D723B|nr:hypothetical protein [Corynebacterium sp. MSK297]MDK8846838.1 hypothetical protein [Corynebacterium sp. MSK297]
MIGELSSSADDASELGKGLLQVSINSGLQALNQAIVSTKKRQGLFTIGTMARATSALSTTSG